jgi:DNA-binding MarR family transcriptional regulator
MSTVPEDGPVPALADDQLDAVTDALMAVSTVLVAVSARSVAAVDDSISLSQFRLLVVLTGADQQKVTDLADTLGVNPSTTTRAVDRLSEAGLVERQTNPRSRREALVSLTGSGRRIVDEVMRLRRTEIAGIVARMPHDHQHGLAPALTAFSEAALTRP